MPQVPVQSSSFLRILVCPAEHDLNMHGWTCCPLKTHKSIFLPWEAMDTFKFCFFKDCVYMGEINSYFQGRTSELKFEHQLSSKLTSPQCFSYPCTFWEGTSDSICLPQIMWVHHCHPLPSLSGSEILTSCFMGFWESHFYSRFIFASLVAPWLPYEELITGRNKSFLMCYSKGKLTLCFICVGNKVLNIWELSYKNVVFQLACLWSLLAWIVWGYHESPWKGARKIFRDS